MSKLISLTSGSKSILINIIKQNPDHNLYLYKSSLENTFNLIDWFPERSIFKLPVNFRIITASKSINKGPFINLFYFTLTAKEQKLLLAYVKQRLSLGLPSQMTSLFFARSLKNSAQVMIGTTWSSNQNYLTWVKTSFISQFLEDPTNNGFHNNLVLIR